MTILKGGRSARIVAATVFALSLGTLTSAGAATGAGAATPTSASVFYLDLGASISVGKQPIPGLPSGQPTDHGYANDLVAMEATKGITMNLTQLGCSGESLAMMIQGGDRCYTGSDSQLSDAVAFLKAHFDETGLVTIDLGFNTFRTCLNLVYANMACAKQQGDVVHQQLSQILATLTCAAGPSVTFLGVGHYNPYLVNSLKGPKGRIFAASSVPAMRLFNETLRTTYLDFNIPMVNIAEAFGASDHHAMGVGGVGRISTNVARICELTWMCQPAPYGPNIHPNDAGYQVMANAIAAMLPAPF